MTDNRFHCRNCVTFCLSPNSITARTANIVATFRKGVRAIQIVGRASTYDCNNSNLKLIIIIITIIIMLGNYLSVDAMMYIVYVFRYPLLLLVLNGIYSHRIARPDPPDGHPPTRVAAPACVCVCA